MGLLPDPLHPALVHFPIALALVALLLEALALAPRWSALSSGALVLWVGAALGGVAAVLSGQAAADAAVVPQAASALLGRHETLGESTMWVLLALAVVRVLLAWRRRFTGLVAAAFLLVACAAAGMIGYQGYLGGELVFRHGVGTAPVQRQPGPG